MILLSTEACTPARAPIADSGLAGSWTLVSLEEGGEGGVPQRVDATGSLLLTNDGQMSVQVMYRDVKSQASGAPVQYAQGGYEASFGHYEVVEPGHSFAYHVDGALVRTLVGKDLKRIYELDGNRLIVGPPTPEEHWRVTWERL